MTSDNPNPQPPPLPSEPKLAISISWCLLIASVVYLAWSANNPPPVDSVNIEAKSEDGRALISQGEATELTLLKLQSKMMIGMHSFNSAEAIKSIDQLEKMVTTPRGKICVAAVNAFIDPKNGLLKAEAILDGISEENSAVSELTGRVRDALRSGVSDVERNELKNEIGWFSKLVKASAGGTSLSSEVRSESIKAMGLVTGAFFLAFLGFVGGLILLILFFIGRSTGKLQMRFNPKLLPGKKHVFLESFVVYISIMALGRLLENWHSGVSFAAYALSFILALFWPLIRGCSWKTTKEQIGWNMGSGFFKEVWAGFLGYLVLLVIAFFGIIGTIILSALANYVQTGSIESSGSGASHPIVGALGSSDAILKKLLLFFLAAGAAPFLEETMFRGALYRYFRHNWGLLLSAVIGGVIFAIIHPQGWVALPALGGMGIGFALIREWRDSLIAPMTAHAINNGVLVGVLLLLLG